MRTILLAALFIIFTIPAQAQISFSEDFEAMNISDPGVLGGAGWVVFANVFDPGGGFLYNYGTFPAPNGGPGFSALDNSVPGTNGGAQYVVTYSDYNNADHANGFLIESLIFQERFISTADLGLNYTFTFDHRTNSTGPYTSDPNFDKAQAFVKVLDQNNGFATLHFKTFDTANDVSWVEGSTITDVIDPSWDGLLLQFGFLSSATQYGPTGVFYDNLSFEVGSTTATPVPTMSEWGLIILALILLTLSTIAIKSRVGKFSFSAAE